MRKILFALALITAGCGHSPAQLPTTSSYSCPSSAVVGTYGALTAKTYAGAPSATSLTDNTVATGAVKCYIVQSLDNQGGISGPSNIAGPFFTPATGTAHSTSLSWTAPVSACSGGCHYVLSSVDAIQTTPLAPALSGNATIAVAKPPDVHTPQNLIARLGK